MAEQFTLPHKLTLQQRENLTMNGVTEVVSFDESAVVLHTELGTLTVQGNNLQLKTLSLDGGQVAISGTAKIWHTISNTMLSRKDTVMPLPTHLWALSVSLRPAQILKKEAAPSPTHHAKALTIQMTGKDTPVAALPK